MASERTRQQVARLRSYVWKFCSIPFCKLRPRSGTSLCRAHFERQYRLGSPTVQPLNPKVRRPYVSAFRAIIRQELRRGERSSSTDHNITIVSTVNELDTFITHSMYIAMADLARRGLGADRKLRGLLKNIQRRFPAPNEAAVNILSVACGTMLSLEIEATPEHRKPRCVQASVFGAIFSLARTPPKRMIVEDKKTGKPIVTKHRYRPRLAGRLIHEATDRHIIQKLARWIMEDKAVRKAVLQRVLTHTYRENRWHKF